MDDAKKSDETTRKEALQQLYSRKSEKAQAKKEHAKESTGEFKIVTERDDMLNPDMLTDSKKSISGRMFKTEDFAASGESWRSPAFDLLHKAHPAATGELPKGVTPGIGHKNANTNAVDAARGEPSSTHTGTTRV